MPTIEDLRAVLVAREEYAGDSGTVLHHLASPPRRRVLAPALAAATVAALAVGGVVLAAHQEQATQPAGGGPTDTVPPATTAPPNANAQLEWDFSVGPVDGYRFTRFAFSAESQLARITGTGSADLAGFVTVYSPGETPKALQLSANGQHMVVNSTDGTFLPGTEPDTVHAVDHPDSWPRLLWHYSDDAWAEVDGPFGFQDDTHMYDNSAARADELRIAQAVRVGPSSAIMMPFALAHPPSEFVIASTSSGASNCLGYDLTGRPQYPSTDTLTVCRIASDRVADVSHQDGNQIAVHAVGDGTSIVCTLDAASLDPQDRDAMAQGGLQAVADQVDASPNPDDPSTWLPVK